MGVIGKGFLPRLGVYRAVFKDKKTGRLYVRFSEGLYGGSGRYWVAKTSGVRRIKATKSRRAQRVPIYRITGSRYNDPKEDARRKKWAVIGKKDALTKKRWYRYSTKSYAAAVKLRNELRRSGYKAKIEQKASYAYPQAGGKERYWVVKVWSTRAGPDSKKADKIYGKYARRRR